MKDDDRSFIIIGNKNTSIDHADLDHKSQRYGEISYFIHSHSTYSRQLIGT
jgi:hypothetical protein